MKESQFDDLTTTDDSMPPPEVATMSLEDFHSGEKPEFEPIHEDDADRFIRESFDDLGDVGDFEEPPIHPEVLESLWKEFGGEGSDDEIFAFVDKAREAGIPDDRIKDFLSDEFGDADENTLQYWLGEDNEDRVIREGIEDEIGDVGDFEQPQSHMYTLRYTVYPSRGEFRPKKKTFKFRERDTIGALKKTLFRLCSYGAWKDFLEELPEICDGDINEENLKAAIDFNAEEYSVEFLKDEAGNVIYSTEGEDPDTEEEDFGMDESVRKENTFSFYGVDSYLLPKG